MNYTVIVAKTLCDKCQNVGSIDALYCIACGTSFVCGEPDAWKTDSLVMAKKMIKDDKKIFKLIGTRKQAIRFHELITKSDIKSETIQDKKYSNVWSVKTEEIDLVQYDLLFKLRQEIINTVKDC